MSERNMDDLVAELEAENAALVHARDRALHIATFNKKEAEKQYDLLLAAQHRIKGLRGQMLNIANGCRIWGGEAERARKMIEATLATPDNTAEIDALMKDAERLNWFELNPRHAQILIDGKAINCVFYGISCAELVKLRDAIDAAMKADK